MGEVRSLVLLENADDIFRVRLGLLAPEAVRRLEVDMIVDAGSVLNLLPEEVVETLGLQLGDRFRVILANDDRADMFTAGPLKLTAVGRSMPADCLVGPRGCEALLGQISLERLDLIVDPTKQQLTVRPESPYGPTFKMKRCA